MTEDEVKEVVSVLQEGGWAKEPILRLDEAGTIVEDLREVETKGTCQDCKWWNIDDIIPTAGPMEKLSECRRHSIYYHRHEDNWCGEFQPR